MDATNTAEVKPSITSCNKNHLLFITFFPDAAQFERGEEEGEIECVSAFYIPDSEIIPYAQQQEIVGHNTPKDQVKRTLTFWNITEDGNGNPVNDVIVIHEKMIVDWRIDQYVKDEYLPIDFPEFVQFMAKQPAKIAGRKIVKTFEEIDFDKIKGEKPEKAPSLFEAIQALDKQDKQNDILPPDDPTYNPVMNLSQSSFVPI